MRLLAASSQSGDPQAVGYLRPSHRTTATADHVEPHIRPNSGGSLYFRDRLLLGPLQAFSLTNPTTRELPHEAEQSQWSIQSIKTNMAFPVPRFIASGAPVPKKGLQ